MEPSQADVREKSRKMLATRDFKAFVKYIWPHIKHITKGKSLVWNWHLDIYCDEITRLVEGTNFNLVLNIPPGSGKSLFCQCLFPAFEWLSSPTQGYLMLSGVEKLCRGFAQNLRSLIGLDVYKELVEIAAADRGHEVWAIEEGIQDTKTNFKNSAGGEVAVLGWTSHVTGFRQSRIIIDDPLDVDNVNDLTVQAVNESYVTRIQSRGVDENTVRLFVMQRLHHNDLAQFVSGIFDSSGTPYRRVSIPMEFDPGVIGIHEKDPRRDIGELMCPALKSAAEISLIKTGLEAAGRMDQWYAQYMQMPQKSKKAQRFRREDFALTNSNDGIYYRMLSIDATFKDTSKSDYCVLMETAVRRNGSRVIVNVLRDRMDFVALIDAILLRLRAPNRPPINEVLIEDKANGPAVVSMLSDVLAKLGIKMTAYDPTKDGSKEARASVAAVDCRMGLLQVWPGAWHDAFFAELESFPDAANDDQVDCLSQFLNYVRDKMVGGIGSAIEEPEGIPYEKSYAMSRIEEFIRQGH